LEWLREIKVEYDKLKILLDSLLGE
jgi:hypothetical protein